MAFHAAIQQKVARLAVTQSRKIPWWAEMKLKKFCRIIKFTWRFFRYCMLFTWTRMCGQSRTSTIPIVLLMLTEISWHRLVSCLFRPEKGKIWRNFNISKKNLNKPQIFFHFHQQTGCVWATRWQKWFWIYSLPTFCLIFASRWDETSINWIYPA